MSHVRYSRVDCRSIKSRVDGVDRNGVERVSGVTADIDNNCEAPRVPCFFEQLRRDERWDSRGEVNAIDENVDIEDLWERAALSRFLHIPLEDVVPTMHGQLFVAKKEAETP